jgi:alpha,alpha-trehalose phosphorylase
MATRHPQRASELGVTAAEIASWREAAASMSIPYDERLGVHPQSEGFTDHAVWDFANTSADQYPLLLHFPYFDLYRKQVVKQADLVLAMHLRGDAFTAEEKARNFAYYEPLTVRDSSLSACSQAVIAAEVGQLELAYDYLGETALVDLHNLKLNTGDGVHLASLAATWIVLVAGFGGMRARSGRLGFAPRLPLGISRLAFRMRYRSRRIAVNIIPESATYQVLAGSALTITHHGCELTLGPDPVSRPIPPVQPGPRPAQPPHRAPRHRAPVASSTVHS